MSTTHWTLEIASFFGGSEFWEWHLGEILMHTKLGDLGLKWFFCLTTHQYWRKHCLKMYLLSKMNDSSCHVHHVLKDIYLAKDTHPKTMKWRSLTYVWRWRLTFGKKNRNHNTAIGGGFKDVYFTTHPEKWLGNAWNIMPFWLWHTFFLPKLGGWMWFLKPPLKPPWGHQSAQTKGMHLFSLPIDTRYACGDSLTLADCVPWVVWKKPDLVGGGDRVPGRKT